MRTEKQNRKRRKSALFLLILISFFFANTATGQNEPWRKIKSNNLPPIASIDNVESENDALTLKIDVAFAPRNWSFHQLFLDTDNNVATGFSVGSIQNGAEFLAEGAFLYRYTGTGRNWSWQPLGTVPFELNADSLRWQINRGTIGDTASPGLTGFRVQLKIQEGTEADSGAYLHHYPVQTSPTAQQLSIPAYIWAGDTANWPRLLSSDPLTLDLLVINVLNGPSTAPVPALVGNIDTARKQGRRVLGYVYTKMGQRNLTEVLADIDRYYAWYGVNGIFVDEADHSCNHVEYFNAIRAHVRRKAADQRVALNPGRIFEECMMQTADILVGLETDATTYLNTPSEWVLPPFASKYPRSRFWHVIHSTTTTQLSAVVARSKALYAGRLWVTYDGPDKNPYDSFPESSFYSALLRLATEQPDATASERQRNAPVKRYRLPNRTPGSPASKSH